MSRSCENIVHWYCRQNEIQPMDIIKLIVAFVNTSNDKWSTEYINKYSKILNATTVALCGPKIQTVFGNDVLFNGKYKINLKVISMINRSRSDCNIGICRNISENMKQKNRWCCRLYSCFAEKVQRKFVKCDDNPQFFKNSAWQYSTYNYQKSLHIWAVETNYNFVVDLDELNAEIILNTGWRVVFTTSGNCLVILNTIKTK